MPSKEGGDEAVDERIPPTVILTGSWDSQDLSSIESGGADPLREPKHVRHGLPTETTRSVGQKVA
jgi:hypothetical protein